MARKIRGVFTVHATESERAALARVMDLEFDSIRYGAAVLRDQLPGVLITRTRSHIAIYRDHQPESAIVAFFGRYK